MNFENNVLERYAQMIPSEMMDVLNESAKAKNITLEMEIAFRLMANLTEPKLTKDNSLLNQILHKEFTDEEAVAECKRKRAASLYLYEMEKLRLFLRFEQSLPKNIKESFMLLDVKEASKQIKVELEAEEKSNKGE